MGRSSVVHRPSSALLLALLALPTAGCSPGFDVPSLVKDLRVLAMRADPPEVIVREPADVATPIRVTALLADPVAPGRTLHCVLQTCRLDEAARRCTDPATTVRLAEGDCKDGENAFPVVMPTPVLEAMQKGQAGYPAYDPGTAVYVELMVTGGEYELHAVKSIVYSPENPPGRVANANPVIESLFADGVLLPAPAPGAPFVVPYVPGKAVRLQVAPLGGSKEHYALPTYDGGVVPLDEYATFAYYADGGAFSRDRATDQPRNTMTSSGDDQPPELWSDWSPPPAGSPDAARAIRFWFVYTDGRGGADWITATALPAGG
jgi:hypothetical protein